MRDAASSRLHCGDMSCAYVSSGADSMRHGERAPPPLLQMAVHGVTVSRRTTNKKLTKLYWSSWKRSPKRPIVLLEPKSGGARPKKTIFVPLPHFRSGPVPPPLSKSFRRHCTFLHRSPNCVLKSSEFKSETLDGQGSGTIKPALPAE